MAGRLTTYKDEVAAAFISNDVVSEPSQSAFEAISVGTAMKARRYMGVSFANAMKRLLTYTKFKVNSAPALAIALVDQNVNEGAVLTYQFNVGSFTDAQTITYSALQADGTALPGWLTFTPATRTFSGTAPAVTADTPISVTVTATDAYGRRTDDTFVITVVNV